MRENNENKLRMYYAVSSICESNIEVWQDNEVFKADFRRFQSKLPQIRRSLDMLKIESIFVESVKSIDRIELEEMTFFLTGKLIDIAKGTANHSLLAQTSRNREDLGNSSEMELIAVCNSVAHNTSEHLNNLITQGITRDHIADLQQLITQYSFNLSKTKTSQSRHKTASESLKKYVHEADDILKNRLDYDIDFYKNSAPEFHQQYKLARVEIAVAV